MQLVSSHQVRAARAFIDWSMDDLARAAKVSLSTVRRLESGATDDISARMNILIRITLEQQGVVFLEDDGKGIGLRVGTLDRVAQ